MKTFNDIGDVRGKRVFVRCDFNVPVTDGRIDDPFRIEKALPTIERLRAGGAKLVLASHIETEGEPTLRPVFEYLKGKFDLSFVEDYFPHDVSAQVAGLPEGGVLLFENLRKHPEEKANDGSFAKHLASSVDIYVDDAFASAHRKHASIVGVPKFVPGYAGSLLQSEVENLSAALRPEHPFVFVLGGAKFDTKLPLVTKFLGLADSILIGGALANDIYKARGLNVGRSLLSDGADVAALANDPKVLVPSDVVVDTGSGRATKPVAEVAAGDAILDAGPASITEFAAKLDGAKLILWNGPLGNFENGYREGTDELAKQIAAASESGARTIVGGGDTLSAISSLGLDSKFSFISTGGGAMLDFLANGTLPGIEAVE